MPTAEELVVALRSEGATEVNSDLKQTEERMEKTADTAERQADQLGGFANKIKGAMAAIVAGLAIGAAGVLSQVPVIGEAMAGLKAVFQAFAFQLDKRLRPGLTNLNTEFFELSNAIMAGDYQQAKKELKDIGNVVSNLNFSPLIEDFKTVATDAINAFTQGVGNANDNMKKEDFQEISSTSINFIKSGLKTAINTTDWSAFIIDVIQLMGKFDEGGKKAVDKQIVKPLTDFIEENWEDWVDAAIDFGKDIVDNIAKGIRKNDTSVVEALSGMDVGGGLTLGDIGGFATMASGPLGGAIETSGRIGDVAERGTEKGVRMILDGRKMSEDTGRYRSDPSRRRGI